jgi:hypothetical protein
MSTAEPTKLDSSGGPYEFTPRQNELLRTLAGKMTFVGTFIVLVGISLLAVGVLRLPARGWSQIISAALVLPFGLWTLRAAGSFREITSTSGRDIAHLMTALANLQKMYALQFWVLIIALALNLLALLVAVFIYIGALNPIDYLDLSRGGP